MSKLVVLTIWTLAGNINFGLVRLRMKEKMALSRSKCVFKSSPIFESYKILVRQGN